MTQLSPESQSTISENTSPDSRDPSSNPLIVNSVPSNAALKPGAHGVPKDMIFIQALLEVLSVRVDTLQGGHNDRLDELGLNVNIDIHGSVIVCDASAPVTLWKRSKENPLRIYPGENSNILFEGPSRHVTASNPLHIGLDIQCCYCMEGELSSKSLTKECIIFDPFVNNWRSDVRYDKVTRRFGKEEEEEEEGAVVVTLEYMLFRDAFLCGG